MTVAGYDAYPAYYAGSRLGSRVPSARLAQAFAVLLSASPATWLPRTCPTWSHDRRNRQSSIHV